VTFAPPAAAAPPSWRGEVLLAALLFLFALAVRLGLRAWTGFDGLSGLDPYAYYDYAGQLGAALARGEAPPPFFWPLGYPLLCVIAGWFLGPGPQAGQAVALLCGALCAPLQYALTRQVLPGARPAAVLAGAMMATAYFAVSNSLMHMSDMPALCVGLCAGETFGRGNSGVGNPAIARGRALRDLRVSQALKVWAGLPIHTVQGPDTEVTRRAGTDANWPRLLQGWQHRRRF